MKVKRGTFRNMEGGNEESEGGIRESNERWTWLKYIHIYENIIKLIILYNLYMLKRVK
jgi:hypothetical protein